jgi:hypothetical protein
MATYAQLLATVQAAIMDVLTTGQSVRTVTGAGDRTLTLANLAELQALEKQYAAAAAMEYRASQGGGRLGITYVTPV